MDDERADEQILEIMGFHGHDWELRTDHTGCKNGGDRAYYNQTRVNPTHPTGWHRVKGYDGLVSDGECPGCARAYRMYLPKHMIVAMHLQRVGC